MQLFLVSNDVLKCNSVLLLASLRMRLDRLLGRVDRNILESSFHLIIQFVCHLLDLFELLFSEGTNRRLRVVTLILLALSRLVACYQELLLIPR